MLRRQPPPRIWLMTDERMGEGLWTALHRLPRGAGVVFRHYGLPPAERKRTYARVARIVDKRGLLLVRAGAVRLGCEAGVHGAGRRDRGLRTASAHSRPEAVRAIRDGAQLLFVSPVFPTRSHPFARTLGRTRLGLMTRGLGVPVVALGGLDERRFAGLRQLGIFGWAGIDAWL